MTASYESEKYVNNLIINNGAENGDSNFWKSSQDSDKNALSIETSTALVNGEKPVYMGQKSFKVSNDSNHKKGSSFGQTYTKSQQTHLQR